LLVFVRSAAEPFCDVPSRGSCRVSQLIAQIEIYVENTLRRNSENFSLKVAGQLPAHQL
jgi:hypothetical protein